MFFFQKNSVKHMKMLLFVKKIM